MKSQLVALFVILFAVFSLKSQGLVAGVSYNYLYANQFDKCIQTYNFNRPFLKEKQSLLDHGLQAELGYLFSNEKSWKQGVVASYSYTGSRAVNDSYINSFLFHHVELNYVFHFYPFQSKKKLFAQAQIGITGSGLFRRVNEEAFLVDEERSKSFGIGGNIGVKVGYHLFDFDKHHLSPSIFVGYTPYVYAPKYEAVINTTQSLVSKSWFSMLNFRLGLTYQLMKD